MENKLKIAVIGAGISGLGSAYLLSKKHTVDIFEKENRLGGHARTSMVEEDGKTFGVDTGFLVFNYETYPLLTKLFEELKVKIENSDMSFGFWDTKSNKAYNGDSLKGLFFQKRNLFSPSHYKMIFDIVKFNKNANFDIDNDLLDNDITLEDYLKPYSNYFKERYLIPMGASIWSTPSNEMNSFPAKTFLRFFKNHGLLGVSTHHQWLTVSNGSINYVEKIAKKVSGEIFLNANIKGVKRENSKVIINNNGEIKEYDKVIFALHAPDALKLLEDASYDEKIILEAFSYKENKASLHCDKQALYPNKGIYASWNYKTKSNTDDVTLTYWINRLQNLKTKKDYFVTLNENDKIANSIEDIEYSHPQFNVEAIKAQSHRELIDGVNNTHFAGAYWRYGFHEDGLYSANTIAQKYGCEL